MQQGELIVKWCGQVAGYTVGFRVERGKEKDTLAVFLQIPMLPEKSVLHAAPAAGVGLNTDWIIPRAIQLSYCHYFIKSTRTWGWRDVFDKPWAQAVQEGSPHFPGGKLEIKATIKLLLEEK